MHDSEGTARERHQLCYARVKGSVGALASHVDAKPSLVQAKQPQIGIQVAACHQLEADQEQPLGKALCRYALSLLVAALQTIITLSSSAFELAIVQAGSRPFEAVTRDHMRRACIDWHWGYQAIQLLMHPADRGKVTASATFSMSCRNLCARLLS